MRIFPIYYHTNEDKRGVVITVFAYTPRPDDDKKFDRIAVKIRYTHWFYASVEKHSYEEVRGFLGGLSSVRLDAPAAGVPNASVVESRHSTVNPHVPLRVVRVHADTYLAKQEAMRMLSNNSVKVHEFDNMLTPLLKMLATRNVREYEWMDIDVDIAANVTTKMKREYIGKLETLCKCKDEIPPPPFSIFSYDLETDCDNTNKMPDAKASLMNAIRVADITFVDNGVYEEHIIVYGPKIDDVYQRFVPSDLQPRINPDGSVGTPLVQIHTVDDELDLIRKVFDMISSTDPDVILGHNIIGFDNPYLHERYMLLIMRKMSGGQRNGLSVRLPNISRLKDHSCSVRKVEWNNSQVAMSGLYYDIPGRCWVDTLVAASRQFFGNMKNNKLDTLAKEHLGMSKNDVSYKDMFLTFRLTRDWNATVTGKAQFAKEDVSVAIAGLYAKMVNCHNKKAPLKMEHPTIIHINNLIRLLNEMNQRGVKMKLFKLIDGLKMDKKAKYDELEKMCEERIQSWNIPLDMSLPPDEMLRVMWWLISMYCLQDTRIPHQVVEQQNIISVLREQCSVFSVDINDVLMKGQVFTVTSSQYRYNYTNGYMVDFGNPGGPTGKYEYEGGYVNAPPGLKIKDDDSLIFSLDFASLYPTVMIAHNICYTTYLSPNMRNYLLPNGDVNKDYIWFHYEKSIPQDLHRFNEELKTLVPDDAQRANLLSVRARMTVDVNNAEMVAILEQFDVKIRDRVDTLARNIVELNAVMAAPIAEKGKAMCSVYDVPNPHTKKIHQHWFIRASIKKGILPGMLWEQYLARKQIKRKMELAKKNGDMAMYATYNAQQLAVKVSMNASYGALGTESNRLACYPAAETITYVGRMSILEANEYVKVKGIGEIVYNDTDSGFVYITELQKKFNKDPQRIKDYANNVAKELSTLFPKPMSMECENFFVSMFVKAKKMYAGIKWDGTSFNIKDYTQEYVTMSNLLYIKGMASVRRDKYMYNKELFNNVLYNILVRNDVTNIIKMLEFAVLQIWNLRKGITNPALIERMFAYSKGITPTAAQGGGEMAKWSAIYESKYGRKPVAGERFDLLVTNVSTGPDADKHTKAPSKLVTMEWLLDEKRTLDTVHYLTALEGDGNVIEIMYLAYPEDVGRKCISKYYLKKLVADGHLN